MDISTGHCKASSQTPSRDHSCSDIWLIDDRLIYSWCDENKVHIWDSEQGTLQIVDGFQGDIEDIRISGDGSQIFSLQYRIIQAWSTLTGKGMGMVNFESPLTKRSLTVNGSKVWVHSRIGEPQGWDFGTSGSSPTQLSNIPSLCLYGTKLWDVGWSRIMDVATGKVVFQLAGRFWDLVRSHRDGQSLVACYKSGEVLILDFNHVPPQ